MIFFVGEYLRNATLPQLLIYGASNVADLPNDRLGIWSGVRAAMNRFRCHGIAQAIELVISFTG